MCCEKGARFFVVFFSAQIFLVLFLLDTLNASSCIGREVSILLETAKASGSNPTGSCFLSNKTR